MDLKRLLSWLADKGLIFIIMFQTIFFSDHSPGRFTKRRRKCHNCRSPADQHLHLFHVMFKLWDVFTYSAIIFIWQYSDQSTVISRIATQQCQKVHSISYVEKNVNPCFEYTRLGVHKQIRMAIWISITWNSIIICWRYNNVNCRLYRLI